MNLAHFYFYSYINSNEHRVRSGQGSSQCRQAWPVAPAADLDVLAYVPDDRFVVPRFRLYGLIDGVACCVAGTDRDGVVRVISLRRAHAKEMKRYVP